MPSTTAPSPTPEDLDFLGCRARVLASGDALGLVDMVEVPPGDMPPLHIHHSEDEGFYVLDGTVTLFMPGQEVTLGAGDFLLAPRGVPHAYRAGDAPARWLVICTPGGFERFVLDVAALEASDPERLTAVAAEHHIEILGPPGTLP